jgi:hypothetical protein
MSKPALHIKMPLASPHPSSFSPISKVSSLFLDEANSSTYIRGALSLPALTRLFPINHDTSFCIFSISNSFSKYLQSVSIMPGALQGARDIEVNKTSSALMVLSLGGWGRDEGRQTCRQAVHKATADQHKYCGKNKAG